MNWSQQTTNMGWLHKPPDKAIPQLHTQTTTHESPTTQPPPSCLLMYGSSGLRPAHWFCYWFCSPLACACVCAIVPLYEGASALLTPQAPGGRQQRRRWRVRGKARPCRARGPPAHSDGGGGGGWDGNHRVRRRGGRQRLHTRSQVLTQKLPCASVYCIS